MKIFLSLPNRKRKLIETDRGKDFNNIAFQNFSNNTNIKHYSRNTSLGAVFAERFNRTIRGLLKRQVLGKGDGNWIDVLSVITKQYKNRIHSSTVLTPIQASLKKNQGYVYNNLLAKREKIEPKYIIHDLARVADLRRIFSKRDTTDWAKKLFKITEFIDTIPSYRIANLPER